MKSALWIANEDLSLRYTYDMNKLKKDPIKNIYILDSEFEVCLFFFENVYMMILK